MDGIEEKLGSILSNPDMMNTIMNMAKALGQSQPEPAPQQPSPAKQPPLQQKAPPAIGKNELEMISRISSLSQQTGLDRHCCGH